ncbi:MAG: hypothetical protein CR997_13840 [Acidobacteria bacterium]|nr:MAG: hypothetical protein CR997_13840 [Acidobacteriota bacterium]
MSKNELSKKTMKSVDSAFNAFYKKDFKKAKTSFEKLISDESLAQWQKTRMEQFLSICNQKLNQPAKIEINQLKPSFVHLSALMNEKLYEEATKMIDTMRDLEKGAAEYLKSEIAIEQDHVEEALSLLTEAIALDPKNRGYAIHSPSYQNYLSHELFSFLQTEE